MSQLVWLAGLLNTSVVVPGGTKGVLLKLNFPYRTGYAYSLLLIRYVRRSFIVSYACFSVAHQSWSGDCLSNVHRSSTKCFSIGSQNGDLG